MSESLADQLAACQLEVAEWKNEAALRGLPEETMMAFYAERAELKRELEASQQREQGLREALTWIAEEGGKQGCGYREAEEVAQCALAASPSTEASDG